MGLIRNLIRDATKPQRKKKTQRPVYRTSYPVKPRTTYRPKSAPRAPFQHYTPEPDPFRSKAERLISDYLINKKIPFQYEVRLQDPTIFALPDFYLPQHNVYVEYWGLINADDPAVRSRYQKNMLYKLDAYYTHHLKVISLIPSDLEDLKMTFPVKFKAITGKDLL